MRLPPLFTAISRLSWFAIWTAMLMLSQKADAQYLAIDYYARKAPDSLNLNLPELGTYLAKGGRNETEVARAIYTWVAHYLDYDDKAEQQDQRINQNLRDILIRRKGLCMDYALLYQALCRHAGIQCEKIDGYAAPRLSENREVTASADHSWNAVRADGQWHLVDATWNEVQDETHHIYGTSYFFTPPAIFLLTHLPEQPMWQLLPCPISADDFSKDHALIYQLVAQQSPCGNYIDSITVTLGLEPGAKRVALARQSHGFNPGPYTKRQWAAALFDYAVALDEATESLPYPDSANTIVKIREQALGYCQTALELSMPQNWQRELSIQLLINQAIGRYQLPSGHPMANNAEDTVALLITAQSQLELLPEEGYFRDYATQQCTQLIEQLSP